MRKKLIHYSCKYEPASRAEKGQYGFTDQSKQLGGKVQAEACSHEETKRDHQQPVTKVRQVVDKRHVLVIKTHSSGPSAGQAGP